MSDVQESISIFVTDHPRFISSWLSDNIPRNKIMALFCSAHRTSILRPPREGNRVEKGSLNSSILVYGLGNGTTCVGNGRFSSLDGKLENVCRINLQPRMFGKQPLSSAEQSDKKSSWIFYFC